MTDETAKLGQEIIKTAQHAGGYLADVLGDLPKDLIGLLAGDKIKAARVERIAIHWDNVKKRLRDRGIGNPESPPLKLSLPILSAVADETREELLDLWERLMAAAIDPKRRGFVRQSIISTVKEMDPFDVLVFQKIANNPAAVWTPNGRDNITRELQSSPAEVLVSFDSLERLRCIAFNSNPHINPMLAPLGTLLVRATEP